MLLVPALVTLIALLVSRRHTIGPAVKLIPVRIDADGSERRHAQRTATQRTH